MSSTPVSAALSFAAALAVAGAAGCGRPEPAPTPAPRPAPTPTPAPVPPPMPRTPPAAVAGPPTPACLLVAPPPSPPETVTVAVLDTIDPVRAPAASGLIEPMLFDLLYDPPVRVDCTGTARAAAAASWSADTGGRTWTLTLADAARFWSGAPVTAPDVVAGWGDVRRLGIDTVVAVDDRRVAVTLAVPSPVAPPAAPPVLGDPALAVRRHDAALAWPEGSGPYRPASIVAGMTTLVPANSAGGAGPVVVFRRWPGHDLRDALDGGADLLVTDDPAAIAYAGTRAGFQVVPLAWDRTYVLVSAAPAVLDDGQRTALARDAVDVDARAAGPPHWWDERGCGSAGADTAGRPTARPAARVVYPQGDRIAGRLAERLVALGIGGRRAVAVGLDSPALATSLHAGQDAAYVLAWPSRPPAAGCEALPRWSAGMRLAPLIDTRRHAIVRATTIGLSRDAAGRPHLELR